MKEESAKQDKLLEATDYLEAVSALKTMKNLFFFIILVFLLATQVCFWLTKLNCIQLDSEQGQSATQSYCPLSGVVGLAAETDKVKVEESESTEKIVKAAKVLTEDSAAVAIAIDANTPTQTAKTRLPRLILKSRHVAMFIRVCNFVLIISAFVYSLALLIGLKVSLIGRLGGINHITRAVFLSIFAIALLFPWQVLFKGVAVGTIYTPAELFGCLAKCADGSVAQKTCLYLRFCGLWTLTALVFLSAQIRTVRWARTMLRRLGIIA